MKSKKKEPLTSSSEVVENHLVLSLTNAIDPIVWRIAFDKVGTASFEIKEIKTSGHHKLVLKPHKETAETIAVFEEREDALTALIQASDAMQKPAKTCTVTTAKPQEANNIIAADSSKKSKKWLWLFLGLITLIALYGYLVNLMPNRTANFGSAQTTASSSAKSNNAQSGVPMSADDFLNNM